MAVLESAPGHTRPDVARWPPWLALGLALFCAASYAVALVLPYYANGLHHRPPGESLHLHELSGLWPYDSFLEVPVVMLAAFALTVAPFVSTVVAGWAGYRAWTDRRVPRRVALWAAALVVSVGTLGWLTTPLAEELIVWFLD
jgi:hypothetical protein